MLARFVAVSLLTVLVSGYGERVEAGGSPASFMPAMADNAFLPPVRALHQKVYWTLFANADYPQIQIAKVPLSKKSKAITIHNTQQNDLLETSGLAFDASGRLWALSYAQTNGNPPSALVFALPIKPNSVPLYTFVLSGAVSSDALAFDPSGNLWVTSPGTQSVVQYPGPFTQSGTLTPTHALTGIDKPFAIAVDKNGKVYISETSSTGTSSIAVVSPPYTGQPYFLNGLSSPGALAFDRAGNLYASSSGSPDAVVRYNSNHLKSGDNPSIVDSDGLPANSYLASFAFTAGGDLYAANCGDQAADGIQVWPLSRKKFSSHLAPSVLYTNKKIQSIGCAWGIAIK